MDAVEPNRAEMLVESASARFHCGFDQIADEVRTERRADNSRAVVARGGWRNRDCPGHLLAQVTVQLQVKRDGDWESVGEGRVASIPARSDGRMRATAGAACVRSAQRWQEWRSVVDVDIVGESDSREALTTPAVRLGCAPPG